MCPCAFHQQFVCARLIYDTSVLLSVFHICAVIASIFVELLSIFIQHVVCILFLLHLKTIAISILYPRVLILPPLYLTRRRSSRLCPSISLNSISWLLPPWPYGVLRPLTSSQIEGSSLFRAFPGLVLCLTIDGDVCRGGRGRELDELLW